MARYNIDTCAMLVEFNASQWTARKLDRSTSDEVVRDKNAGEKGAARVNKNLLAGRKELEIINQHVGFVRNYVYEHTLPWSDSGIRLLPAPSFMLFDAEMTKHHNAFEDLVREFIGIYPTLITAQAMALGDMFKRDEYPTAQAIAEKFRFRVGYMPVPTAGDFRVDVGNEAQAELKQQLEKLQAERVETAMADVRARLGEHLRRMSDRLAVDVINGEVKTRRFHDSLVSGALELCDIVKSLNVVGDTNLEDTRRSLANLLSGVEPDDLRKNMGVRTDVRAQVDQLLDKFAF